MTLPDWLLPKWKRSDPHARADAANKTTNQRVLARLALDKHHAVRHAAILRLRDKEALVTAVLREEIEDVFFSGVVLEPLKGADELLARIALHARHRFARETAAKLVSNAQVLGRIALQTTDEGMLGSLVSKLDDQEVISQLISRSQPAFILVALVRKARNQDLLARIYEDHQDDSVRKAIAPLLTDQGLLARLVAITANSDLRCLLMRRITDPKTLAQFATRSEDAQIREDAVTALRDPQLLTFIAQEDSSVTVRLRALRRIDDQTVLAALATQSEHPQVRRSAAEKLQNKALLAHIAENDTDSGVRQCALQRVADQVVLARVASSSHDAVMRRIAASKLTDNALLAQIIIEDSDDDVRNAAVKAVGSDPELQTSIVRRLPPGSLRSALLQRITSQTALAELATRTPVDDDLRLKVVSKLRDQNALGQVALNDGSGAVRAAAAQGMHDRTTMTRVFHESNDSHVKRICLPQLDQETLLTVALDDPDADLRSAAVVRLEGDTRLSQVALRQGSGASTQVVRRIIGPETLSRVAKEAPDEETRRAAIMQLNDRQHLEQLLQVAGSGREFIQQRLQLLDRATVLGAANQFLRYRDASKHKFDAQIRVMAALLAQPGAPRVRIAGMRSRDPHDNFPWMVVKAGTWEAMQQLQEGHGFGAAFQSVFSTQPTNIIWADHIAENCPRPGEALTSSGRAEYARVEQALRDGRYILDRLIAAETT